jgi:hypothetical protein
MGGYTWETHYWLFLCATLRRTLRNSAVKQALFVAHKIIYQQEKSVLDTPVVSR